MKELSDGLCSAKEDFEEIYYDFKKADEIYRDSSQINIAEDIKDAVIIGKLVSSGTGLTPMRYETESDNAHTVRLIMRGLISDIGQFCEEITDKADYLSENLHEC